MKQPTKRQNRAPVDPPTTIPVARGIARMGEAMEAAYDLRSHWDGRWILTVGAEVRRFLLLSDMRRVWENDIEKGWATFDCAWSVAPRAARLLRRCPSLSHDEAMVAGETCAPGRDFLAELAADLPGMSTERRKDRIRWIAKAWGFHDYGPMSFWPGEIPEGIGRPGVWADSVGYRIGERRKAVRAAERKARKLAAPVVTERHQRIADHARIVERERLARIERNATR